MARTISVPNAVYAVGSYGPFSVNGFNASNCDRIVVEMTSQAWPSQDDPLGLITITLQDGSVMNVNIPSQPKSRDGTPMNPWRILLGIPERDGVKQSNASAKAEMLVYTEFETAITVRAE